MAFTIDKDACLGCGACEGECPVGAIHADADGKYEIDADACIGCGACEHVCPARPMPGISVNGIEAQWWTTPAKGKAAFVGPPTQLDAALANVARQNSAW